MEVSLQTIKNWQNCSILKYILPILIFWEKGLTQKYKKINQAIYTEKIKL